MPGPSVSIPGRTTVQSLSLAMSAWSASAFARRYTLNTLSSSGGLSAPTELTIT